MDAEVSVIGYGSWGVSGQWSHHDDDEGVRAIHAAMDGGVNLFDTAPIYGFGHAEEVLGRALRERGQRDRWFVASKAGLRWNGKGRVRNDLSRGSLCQEIDEILKRLKTDYIDLWQIHWPADKVPLEETLSTMDEIRRKGKVRYIGVCNFSVNRLKEALSLAPVASWQGLYNLLEPNASRYHSIDLEYRTGREVLPFTRERGLMVLPYSPLMQGLLSGKWSAENLPFDDRDVRASNPEFQGGALPRNLSAARELKALAAELGWSLPDLALAWLTDQPAVTSVIAGARRTDHAQANARAGDLTLPAGVGERIETIIGKSQEDK